MICIVCNKALTMDDAADPLVCDRCKKIIHPECGVWYGRSYGPHLSDIPYITGWICRDCIMFDKL